MAKYKVLLSTPEGRNVAVGSTGTLLRNVKTDRTRFMIASYP